MRKSVRYLLVAGLAITLVALATGCGGGGGKTAKAAARAVTVHASDFSFPTAIPATLPAGDVHVTLVNDSKAYQHELWIYPQSQPKLQELIDQKAAGQDASEADFLQNVAGKVEDLDPGKSTGFDAHLAPGTYEYACFITSKLGDKDTVHYTLGMHGTFTVQ